MEEKIIKIREKLIKELEKLEDGIVIKLDYGIQFLDAILFDYFDNREYKKFALPMNILCKIDLSNVSFDKFMISRYHTGCSFKGLHGVNINPQTIYNKDLINAGLYGVNFIGPFDDVKIMGADFTGSTGAVINPMKLCSRGLYVGVRNCNFSGVKFTKPFKFRTVFDGVFERKILQMDIEGSNFTGSIGAVIDLSPAKEVEHDEYEGGYYVGKEYISLERCTLTDAKIKGSYKNINISGANFRGAKGNLTINPQEVKDRKLDSCNFKGVIFNGPFYDCNISDSDFTGSLNAHINVSELDERQFKGTNFTDARVMGLEAKGLTLSEDGFIEDGVIETINIFLGIEHETELIKKQQLEEARKKLVELNKRKIKEKIKELSQLIQTQAYLGIPESKIYGSIPITQEVFLKSVNDHYEIDEEFIDISLLRFLNLSLIDFTNVKVRGIDFRHTSARINPQTVYNKDISNCTFDDSNVKFFDDYTGVIMENTNFEQCDFDTPKRR